MNPSPRKSRAGQSQPTVFPAYTPITARAYGSSGPRVFVLHGGPGAAGYMAPVARALADAFRVLEPWQRGSGEEPLTVARHVEDLHRLLEAQSAGEPPALVGHSWGAMLALAYAAAHPGQVRAIALIGCGTFDPAARNRMREICDRRMTPALRQRLQRLPEEIPDPDECLQARGSLLEPLYSYDVIASDDEETADCDARANQETWNDMLRLQAEGVYPASFASITVPVIMLHGADDPHPGRMIRAGLAPFLPQLEYREWKHCGHYPWREREAREGFFTVLREWLAG
jgi:pimeloyl-ACP methyl ester carboxylesterase